MDFLDKLLLEGHCIMPHPKCMSIMGVKESQYKIRLSKFGIQDTKIYRNILEWKNNFIKDWNRDNSKERVIKPNKGSQGEGVWMLRNIHSHNKLNLESQIQIQEARDNRIQKITLNEFGDIYIKYLLQKGGLVINQPFLPRIVEGEIRLILLNDKVISILKKVPIKGGISATINSGAIYTEYSPEDNEYYHLVNTFLQELPIIKDQLHIQELPLIWSADFIQDQPNDKNELVYCISEFNCTCVGIKTIVNKIAPLIAKYIDKIIVNR
jgi:hypothetical protein